MTRIVANWVTAPSPAAVMAALGEGFFVGGCVRNALMDRPVADIDIATPLMPEEVCRRLEAAGIRTHPTGLQHGTITAVVEGEPVEVTTFRTDIETDGRHAVVHFTTDMALDAGRRDFTMNALYATADGTVIDPLGGLPDLHARRVRFIGDPHDRIREDYVRILRFFRFHALYGGDGIDADGLAACAELADGIDGLARERIGWEFRKLLGAPDPAPSVASMAASGVLARCLPGANAEALAPLVHAEEQANRPPDWVLRLFALGSGDMRDALRLSRAEASALQAIQAALDLDRPWEAAYRLGVEAATRAALIKASVTGDLSADLLVIEEGAAARFPLAAADLIAAGHKAGPTLGAALKAAEAAWIDSRFTLDKPALIALAAKVSGRD